MGWGGLLVEDQEPALVCLTPAGVGHPLVAARTATGSTMIRASRAGRQGALGPLCGRYNKRKIPRRNFRDKVRDKSSSSLRRYEYGDGSQGQGLRQALSVIRHIWEQELPEGRPGKSPRDKSSRVPLSKRMDLRDKRSYGDHHPCLGGSSAPHPSLVSQATKPRRDGG